MSYPPRSLVAEPFVSQMETVERALIDVQSQPMPYYGRRNTTQSNNMTNTKAVSLGGVSTVGLANVSMGLALPQSAHPNRAHHHHHQHNTSNRGQINGESGLQNGKYGSNVKLGYYKQPQKQAPQTLQPPQGLQNVQNLQVPLNVRANGTLLISRNSLSANPQQNAAANSSINSSVGMRGITLHIPQVFNDEKVYTNPSTILGNQDDSPLSMDARLQEKIVTFDPFGSGIAGINNNGQAHGLLLLPVFNSSTQILGSNYNATSTNIWGSGSKTVAGDAAVWG